MYFELIGEITHIVTFASGSGIRELARLRKHATRIGRRELKIKRLID